MQRFLPHESVTTLPPPKRDEARVQSLCYANARECVCVCENSYSQAKTVNDTIIET